MAEKRNRSFVGQRRDTIMSMLRERKSISVSELSELLEISPLTVRRDLSHLEEQGLIHRKYGEAVLVGDSGETVASGLPAVEAIKESIANYAASLVSDQELLLVNTSTTALMAVKYIEAQGVTVVTNSATASALPIPPNGTVLMTGGEVRPPRGVLSGEFALANIRSVSAARCFVGCAGISLSGGVTSCTQQEAMVNSLMVERSGQLVLLMDSSKIGVEAGFSYAPLSRISLLITDTNATDESIEALYEGGVQEIVRIAP